MVLNSKESGNPELENAIANCFSVASLCILSKTLILAKTRSTGNNSTKACLVHILGCIPNIYKPTGLVSKKNL